LRQGFAVTPEEQAKLDLRRNKIIKGRSIDKKAIVHLALLKTNGVHHKKEMIDSNLVLIFLFL
jgi:hypothetical protein